MQISVELEGVGFGAGASFLVSIVSVYDDCVTVDRDAGVSDVSSSCEVCASLVPGFKLFDPGICSCLEISPKVREILGMGANRGTHIFVLTIAQTIYKCE